MLPFHKMFWVTQNIEIMLSNLAYTQLVIKDLKNVKVISEINI